MGALSSATMTFGPGKTFAGMPLMPLESWKIFESNWVSLPYSIQSSPITEVLIAWKQSGIAQSHSRSKVISKIVVQKSSPRSSFKSHLQSRRSKLSSKVLHEKANLSTRSQFLFLHTGSKTPTQASLENL
ncbi:hypothetical protein ACMFMG_010794 [Clarireedia jacksonii]